MNKELRSWKNWNKISIDDRQRLLFDLGNNIWMIDRIINDWENH